MTSSGRKSTRLSKSRFLLSVCTVGPPCVHYYNSLYIVIFVMPTGKHMLCMQHKQHLLIIHHSSFPGERLWIQSQQTSDKGVVHPGQLACPSQAQTGRGTKIQYRADSVMQHVPVILLIPVQTHHQVTCSSDQMRH